MRVPVCFKIVSLSLWWLQIYQFRTSNSTKLITFSNFFLDFLCSTKTFIISILKEKKWLLSFLTNKHTFTIMSKRLTRNYMELILCYLSITPSGKWSAPCIYINQGLFVIIYNLSYCFFNNLIKGMWFGIDSY